MTTFAFDDMCSPATLRINVTQCSFLLVSSDTDFVSEHLFHLTYYTVDISVDFKLILLG